VGEGFLNRADLKAKSLPRWGTVLEPVVAALTHDGKARLAVLPNEGAA